MTSDPSRTGSGNAIADTPSGKKRGSSLKERAAHQLKQFVVMFLYLFVLLGLLTIHESIILERNNINFTHYGFALVNALILAKVMLVAEDLHLGRKFEDRPLIYPVLFKSLLFAITFICFHVIENVVIGLWHGKAILESIPGIGGGGIRGLLSVGVIVSVALIPFFAFKEISRIFGSAALQTLIFKRGPKDVIIEFKLRVPDGD